MTGLTEKEKEAKRKQMAKQAKMDDDDPDAYKEMAGSDDARKECKVKTSEFNKRYHDMYGDDELDESKIYSVDVEKALNKKAEQTVTPIGFIRDVMKRYMGWFR